MFDIFLTKEVVPEADPGVVALYGKICIGDYLETLIASLYSWNEAMYQQHWESALGRLVEGETKSALITSYADPTVAKYIFWWPLYRDGDTVYVQNHMLHYDQLPRPFSILDPWKSMHERRTVTRTVGKSQSGKLTYETFHWLSLRLKSGWRILEASATFVWLHS